MWDAITEPICKGIREGILDNFETMFDTLNIKVAEIATDVGKTPQDWNSGIFTMVKNLSDTVILPVAGVILTFVLCYELIQMIISHNNISEIEYVVFFKWIFKTMIAVLILTHTFDIVMAVFELAQKVTANSAGIIAGSLDVDVALTDLETALQSVGLWGLIELWLESQILKLAMIAIEICIFIIIYGRMIEIYLTISIAPIPLATLANKEWGSIGQSYLKGIFALAFQGFLIMVCIGIYAALLGAIGTATNGYTIQRKMWSCAGYTILLCMVLFKTGNLSKSLFGSH
jgi:hypothetical protein